MFNNQENLNSLDIQQARVKFILFKSKLRSVLYGSALDESILSPRNTPLGHWLYNSALTKYSYIPEVQRVEKINNDVISKAKSLIDLYNSGKIEEARQGLESLHDLENELISLLGTIERKAVA